MEKSRIFAKQTLVKSVPIVLASVSMMALMACGAKTNPVEDYPEFENWGKKTDQQPRTQTYPDTNLYFIESDELLNFVEGQTRSYYIKPRLLVTGVEYSLSATGLPEGASFVKAKEAGHEGEYVLTWTPAVGTISSKEPNGRSMKFQIVTNVLKTSDPKSAEIMQRIGHDREKAMFLVRTNEEPLVEKVDLGGEAVVQGETKTFSVVVKDLGAWNGSAPELYAKAQAELNQENTKTDGIKFLTVADKVESLGENRWKFSAALDTSSIVIPNGKDSISVRVTFVVSSPSNNWSPKQTVDVRVTRKATAQNSKADDSGSQGDKK